MPTLHITPCTRRVVGTALAWVAVAGMAGAQPRRDLADLQVQVSPTTGRAILISPKDAPGASTALRAIADSTPLGILRQYRALFGVTDAAQELQARPTVTDDIGHQHTTYEQVFKQVPVFGGMIKVHHDHQGRFSAANGFFHDIPAAFETRPTLDAAAATQIATKALATASPRVEQTQSWPSMPVGWDSPGHLSRQRLSRSKM